MAYIPEIVDYRPFYIQTAEDSVAINTTEWGLIAKSNPFPLLPTPKEIYSNNWMDENGEEEYVDDIYYQSIEFKVAFYVKTLGKTSEQTLRSQIDDFFRKISKGEFMIYDSYTGIGRRKVRYAGYEEESFKRSENWSRAIFTVSFKVNDPTTRIVLKGNKLEEE